MRRHGVTETAEIAAAIEVAAGAWPEHAGQRTVLLRRLVLAGVEVAQREQAERRAAHQTQAERLSGSRPGVWPADAVEELHGDWPE